MGFASMDAANSSSAAVPLAAMNFPCILLAS
jgi:hypothetical protein